ncbi:MAG: TonB-dependent receptor [Magnetococcus sp. YQC-3]
MHKIYLIIPLLALSMPGLAMTDEEMPATKRLPLLITFGKTEQTAAELPASTSTLSQEDLKSREIRDLDQAARHVPNLMAMGQGSGGRSTYLFLRGVGSTHNEPAINFLVDDVPMSSEGLFDLNFVDVGRIEVLRGPQGTLYGRNALGGVISVSSEPSGGPPQGQVNVNVGNLGFHQERVKLQTPIPESSLHLRLSGSKEQRDGYSRNALTGRDVEWVEQTAGQMRVSWLPTGPTDADLIIKQQYADNGGFALNPPGDLAANPRIVRLNQDGENHKNQTTARLRINHDATDFSLVSITAADLWRNRLSGDADYSSVDLARVAMEDDKTLFSQEFRLSKRSEGNRWLLGSYLASDRFARGMHLAYQPTAAALGLVPQPLTDVVHDTTLTRNFALFGEVTRTPFPDWELTFGLRYDLTRKEGDLARSFEQNGLPMAGTASENHPSLQENVWLPKYSVLYHLTAEHALYATVAKGYRSGGFNTYDTTAGNPFAAESLWNHEVGFKSSWPSRRLQVGGALFDIEWQNQQVQQILPNFAPVTRNAGESRSLGGELELTWSPVEDTRFNLAYGYADARFLQYKDPVLGQDYADRRVPATPLHTIALGVEHRRALEGKWSWFGRADLEGRGNLYWDAANTSKQGLEPLLHLRTGWRYANWEVALWGHNVLDQSVQLFGEASPTQGTRLLYAEPRTVGISLGATFQ